MSEAQCFFCKGMFAEWQSHHCVPDNADGYEYVVESTIYRDTRPSISVGEIRTKCGVGANYNCLLETAKGDFLLVDGQSIDLRTRPRLSFIPPASY